MKSKTVSKTLQVRDLLITGEKDYKTIAEIVGCDLSLVYQMKKKLYPDSVRKYTVKTRKLKNKTKYKPITFVPIKVKDAKVDAVNSPPHYTAGGVEVYDFIKAKKLSYELGNVVKYVSRADHKGSRLEDLKKAQWYLAAAIKQEERV